MSEQKTDWRAHHHAPERSPERHEPVCGSCGGQNPPMRKDDRNQIVCDDCFSRWRFFDAEEAQRWRIVSPQPPSETALPTIDELRAANDEAQNITAADLNVTINTTDESPPEAARCGECHHHAAFSNLAPLGICKVIVREDDIGPVYCGHRCTFPAPEVRCSVVKGDTRCRREPHTDGPHEFDHTRVEAAPAGQTLVSDLQRELAFYFGQYHGTTDHSLDVLRCRENECERVRNLLNARATPPSPAPRRIACMNPNCIDGKVSVGCAIDKPLLTTNCPDCNPPKRDWEPNKGDIPNSAPKAESGDPTRFLDRSFTVVENTGQNIRLINREDPAQALTLPWNDLAPLREIITLVLNDGPMVIGPAPDKGEVASDAIAQRIIDNFHGCMLVPDGYTHESFYKRRIASIIEAELG